MQMQDKLIDVMLEFQFPELEHINISNKYIHRGLSKIGEVGVRKLFNEDWPVLNKIGLGN